MQHWNQSTMRQTANQIAEMLDHLGIRCKAIRQPRREYIITDPRGLIQYARLEFLETGELVCVANGFSMADKPYSLSKFASAIAGRFPRGEHGNMESYGFARLEMRNNRPF